GPLRLLEAGPAIGLGHVAHADDPPAHSLHAGSLTGVQRPPLRGPDPPLPCSAAPRLEWARAPAIAAPGDRADRCRHAASLAARRCGRDRAGGRVDAAAAGAGAPGSAAMAAAADRTVRGGHG